MAPCVSGHKIMSLGHTTLPFSKCILDPTPRRDGGIIEGMF